MLVLAGALFVIMYLATGLYGPSGSDAAKKTNEHRIDYNIEWFNLDLGMIEGVAVKVI